MADNVLRNGQKARVRQSRRDEAETEKEASGGGGSRPEGQAATVMIYFTFHLTYWYLLGLGGHSLNTG